MVLNRANAGNRGLGTASNAGVGFRSKRIQAGLSTQIIIEVEEGGVKFVIGAVQSLAINQSRTIGEIKEVGTDGIIGLVPQTATTYTADISRVVFDFQRLPQALQREYRNIHAQRRPFDIIITDYNPYIGANGEPTGGDTDPDGGGGTVVDNSTGAVAPNPNAVITTLKNCWFASLSFSYAHDNYMITETAKLKIQNIFDSVATHTLAGTRDALERNTNPSNNASVMSAFDATRVP